MTLTLHNLSKAYGGFKVVDDVSFEVSEARLTGIIGPNGAGKSTLFSLITGFIEAITGFRARRPRSAEARDGITIGVLTMLLGLVLIAVIFFAPQPYNVEGHEFVLTRTIVAVGLFGGYVAVVAVFLAIAGFSPRRFAVHSGDVDAAAEASTDDIARAAGAASTPNPTRDNA
ncbi:MAG TPA: ATP-binding cassette domain-containing protein [Microbacteriaceae bacterium]|nr:ATP-binding cassette domain-containing protein [Microbacteriaceae bacterium]